MREAPEAEAWLLDTEKWKAQIAERRRRQACLKNVSRVREADLRDSYLLYDILFAKIGNGPATVTRARA